MNKTFYISLFLISVFGFKTYSQTDTIVENISFNYIVKNDNGQIKELGNYNLSGKNKHGYWIIYDSTGTIIEKGNYQKEKKDGFWKEKGDDNKCCWSGPYKRGKKHGTWFNGGNVFVTYKKDKVTSTKIVRWL